MKALRIVMRESDAEIIERLLLRLMNDDDLSDDDNGREERAVRRVYEALKEARGE